MRIAGLALFLAIGAPFAAAASASAAPLPLADHAAQSRAANAGLVEEVGRRYAYKKSGKRYAKRSVRRYDWTYYPYWRPYYYYHWQQYYPYGGPLF